MQVNEPVKESDFLPTNVLPLEVETRQAKKATKLAQNPTKVAVKGGKRVVRVKVNIPIEQYAGLQRFEGASDSEKINAIVRMANRRVDEVQMMRHEEQKKALQLASDPATPA